METFKIKCGKDKNSIVDDEYEKFGDTIPFWYRLDGDSTIFITQPYKDVRTMETEIHRRKWLKITETFQIEVKDLFEFADLIKKMLVVENI